MKTLSGVVASLLLLLSFGAYGNDWTEPTIDPIDGTIISVSPSLRYPNSKLVFAMNPKQECDMLFVVVTLLDRTFPEDVLGRRQTIAKARVDKGKIYEGPVGYFIENISAYESRVGEAVPADNFMFEEMLRGQSLIFKGSLGAETDEFSLIGLTHTYKTINDWCRGMERRYEERNDDWSEPSQRKTPKSQALPTDDHEWSA